jgi:hypothetical protein
VRSTLVFIALLLLHQNDLSDIFLRHAEIQLLFPVVFSLETTNMSHATHGTLNGTFWDHTQQQYLPIPRTRFFCSSERKTGGVPRETALEASFPSWSSGYMSRKSTAVFSEHS